MKYNTIFLTVCLVLSYTLAGAQERVGINTTNPNRNLEMQGFGEQFLRVQSTNTFGNEAGVELIRGTDANNARDWKIANNAFGLRLATSTDNFASNQTMLLIDEDGNMGIGVVTPATRLHIVGGEDASNTGDGYLLVGPKSSSNLVFDNNEIVARSNGSSSPLFIQSDGGSTFLGFSGGSSSTYVSGGNVVVGGGLEGGLLNIQSEDKFQMHLTNTGTNPNQWNIGATNQNWAAGDDQLVFTPTASSNDAPLRLADVGDNDGNMAPVIIQSSASQTLLLDGNEIDAKSGPLYINHNSENDTYINPSGGKIGVGTTNPHGQVHIVTENFALGLQRESTTWKLAPMPIGDVMFSNDANGFVAMISYNGGGAWVPLSDSTRKENVVPMKDAMDQISALSLHTYQMKAGPGQTDIGVIAQELEQILPEAVFVNEGQYGVTYDQLTALAVKGVQEQQQEIEELLALWAKLDQK